MSKENKKIENAEQSFEKIESTLSRSERFFEENQKMISIVIISILVVVGGFFAYNRFYKLPLEKEAQAQMFVAERYFEVDSFKLALAGDPNYPGFLKIIEDYGSTKSGNLAQYYAGVCYINLGDYDNAISYLKDFSPEGKLVGPISRGLIGDAYMEKNMMDDAEKYYKEAVDMDDNNFTSPIYMMKLAEIYELKNEYNKALSLYENIQENYPKTNEGRTIEKFIERAKLKLNKN